MNELRGRWRGKSKDKGLWIEGICWRRWEHFWREFRIFILAVDGNGKSLGEYEIDPTTLGACTGSRDKNGEPVFEGDILERDDEALYLVEWSDRRVAFVLSPLSTHRGNIFTTISDYKVVGNKHDNPELLRISTGKGSGGADQDTILPAT